jgi:hypothetical protein
MGESGHTEQPVEEARPATVDNGRNEDESPQVDSDVKDVDMDPEDHVNRPDQPDFDPAERQPYDDPTAGQLPPGADPLQE